MTNNIHTHYDTLMVSRNASAEVIRAAFRSLSQKYHPDKNNHPNADQIMQQFNEAYKVLSDPIERSKYDRSLAEYESKSNDEHQHNYAKTDNLSARQNKVVVINIPDSISLSGAKENLRKFSSNIHPSTKSNLKELPGLIFKIIVLLFFTFTMLLLIAALLSIYDF